ncbi:mannosyl-3-phosphoglycerate phosphatase [Methanohalobium sp.]|uniref:mannosyl-3-phosphoglycerate phosphatase n=1 Tax=Methanohalobium sp. TaxID=2837493 RepID=UPI0025D45C40|nr:mannosyl-3-phosphoglycerate phosphatase [Methanohalobium sp.]
MNYVVFTDLDGTLIDHNTYSYEPAKPALELLEKHNIPLVICTSKTRAEIEVYVKKLNSPHPFISENGGAIFIPKGYFDVDYDYTMTYKNYNIIELGTEYTILRQVLEDIKSSVDVEIIGFGDLDNEDVSKDTGLDIKSARLAKMREYDEAFKVKGEYEDVANRIIEIIKSHGLNYTRGGRYWHLIGNNDKGKSVETLSNIYRKQFGNLQTVGLGDSLNDYPMLKSVDIPYLVQKSGGIHDDSITDSRINRIEGIGPKGWNKAIIDLISNNTD